MLIRLDDPQARDAERCGAKASTLARLVAQGFPVPTGFVVPTSVLSNVLNALGLHAAVESLCRDETNRASLTDLSGAIHARILSAHLPADLQQSIAEIVHTDSATKWAVRSSAIAEDTHEASFAGQYETLLGLREAGEIARGILHCWASLFSPRAVHYRREHRLFDCRAAVIVQHLVDADAAGVCFTVDPVLGNSQRIVIDANFGLGESVVSGIATPDGFVVDRHSKSILSREIADKSEMIKSEDGIAQTVAVPNALRRMPSITDEQALAITNLALQVESAQGHAVDIEWAFARGQLYLLQARPITVVGANGNTSEDQLPPLDWVPETNTRIDPRFSLYSNGNISEVLPGCVTPLSWDHTGRIIEAAFRKQLIELGAIKPGGADWQVMGFFYHRPYICVSFLADAARNVPVMTPDTIYEEFVGKPETTTPPFGLVDLLPHRWHVWWRSLSAIITRLRNLSNDVSASTRIALEQVTTHSSAVLATWSDSQLLEAVRCTDELVQPSAIHTWTSTFAVVSFSFLRALTQAWLGDQDSSLAAELATGIDQLASTAPASAIYELADDVRGNEQWRACFELPDDQAVLRALTQDATFKQKLDDFLAQFGHRAVSEAEFIRPCWREDPAQVIALIRNDLQPGTLLPATIRERQQAIYHAALARLDSLNPVQRKLLTVLIARTRQFITDREQMKNVSILRADRSRRVYAELRHRLLVRNLLRQADDIYFLVWDEIRALITEQTSTAQIATVIAKRRSDYAQCQRIVVPKLQNGKPRFLMVADYPSEKQLRGMGVSPGRVQGRARVVLEPRTQAHIEPGEILVAPVTDVAWTPLFLQAAGLVVEVGGLLSHGSVVAREYGLPAIVGVAEATKIIRTGDLILLDGNAGTVVKLE